MANVEAVVIGDDRDWLSFTDPAPDGSGVEVELHVDSLRVATSVSLHHPDDIADFFAELNARWRGWEGDLGWTDGDAAFSLIAVHDRIRRVRIYVQARDPYRGDYPDRPEWSASGWVSMEPAALVRAEAALRHMMAAGQRDT